jgi:protein-tyrosine phosphatase
VLPLVDAHVHLLAGLDDGPRDQDEAVEMCRLAADDGTRLAASLAHQSEQWPDVTPERIRAAAGELSGELKRGGVDLEIVACAEVMLRVDLLEAFQRGKLLTVGGHGRFMLLEMPHDLYVDARKLVEDLGAAGVRAILAHPERTPALLHEPGAIEELIDLGCLVQVSAKSLTQPPSAADERALRDWVKRGVVHMLGSDGHSRRRRPPLLGAAVQRIRRWAGESAADRIGSTVGQLVLRGMPFRAAKPAAPARRWWALPWR